MERYMDVCTFDSDVMIFRYFAPKNAPYATSSYAHWAHEPATHAASHDGRETWPAWISCKTCMVFQFLSLRPFGTPELRYKFIFLKTRSGHSPSPWSLLKPPFCQLYTTVRQRSLNTLKQRYAKKLKPDSAHKWLAKTRLHTQWLD